MIFLGEVWKKPLPARDPGEVGRVYYINIEAIFDDNVRWSKGVPFTLNPEHGKTLEGVLLKSKEIPNVLKRKLIEKREAEMKINSGLLKFYISDEQAPDTWGEERHDKEKGSGLILL